MASRYLIGIDLGTSNSALSYVDTLAEPPESRVLPIPQLEMPGVTAEATTLPSFVYLPVKPETGGGDKLVGLIARNQTGNVPGRVIASAKSWLVHPGVDPQAKLLPWGSPDVASGARLSPVEVQSLILKHLRDAWDRTLGAHHPAYAFDRQDVTVTVPASFDESAQSLTLEAAKLAGFKDSVRLLEEPQAAFYYWLEKHSSKEGDGLKHALLELLPALKEAPQTVLVCDLGGGTTDFSLFRILPIAPRVRIPRIERIAVSDHILLGGDNIDLAIARRIEILLKGSEGRLSPRQWSYTAFVSRSLKERILSAPEAEPDAKFFVSIPGEGASLFAQAMSAEVSRREIEALILDGFFPLAEKNEAPKQTRERALVELGLPYAHDTAVTRHLAAFLAERPVDAVLFTGGTLKPRFLQDRLLEQIAKWQDGRVPVRLVNDEMDLAVARGAAYYGAVRRTAARIRGGYPHAVFVELYRESESDPMRAVCLLPKGFEAGGKLKIDGLGFKLLVDRPVRFQLYYSNRRDGDKAGDIVTLDEEDFRPLPPLQTQLTLKDGMERPKEGALAITLEATVSETGLLQLFCVHRNPGGSAERWQLDFNLRKTGEIAEENAAASGIDAGVKPERLRMALDRIELFYGKKRLADVKETPRNLKRELEKILSLDMEEWNIALCRALWPPLSGGARGRSAAHELTWLQLAGFVLRPGYGADLDPWRISELWRIFPQGPAFPSHPGTMLQWWILWRRVAGGLDAARQAQVMEKILTPIKNRNDAAPEVILLAGSLERVDAATRRELGDHLTRQLVKKKVTNVEPHLWALGRLSNRVPLYAAAEAALPAHEVVPWVEKLLLLDWRPGGNINLFLSQACRQTGGRELDLPPDTRDRALAKMHALGAAEEQLRMVREVVAADRSSQARTFGESLPSGLKLAE